MFAATRSIFPVLLSILLLADGCTYFSKPYYRDSATAVPAVAPADVDHRLFLIGDAGDAKRGKEPALLMLAERVREMPDKTTVVFLGDNVYERGMPEPPASKAADTAAEAANVLFIEVFQSRQEAEERLDAELDVVRGTTAKGIFIPGNHDWDPFATDGWKRVLEQQKYIDAAASAEPRTDIRMLPGGGCPGPVPVPLGKTGMVVALDTQWFLETAIEHQFQDVKPCESNNPTNCPCVNEQQVVSTLESSLETAAKEGRWAIVVGHHPLNSRGPHGGFVEPLTHLFPLRFMRHYLPWYMEWIPMPVIGTAMVLARQHFSPSTEDFSNKVNEHLRHLLRNAMADAEDKDAPALVYAAGHDHSLQVFQTSRGPRFNLVSGLGSTSRASEVGATHNTLFAHANGLHPGFMQVDFLRSGAVRLGVLEADGHEGEGHEVFSKMLAGPGELHRRRARANNPSLWRRLRGGGFPWIPGLHGGTPAQPTQPPAASAPVPEGN